MQPIDWNDLRYVLALARDGSYAAAAQRLAVDPTTIARRLRAVETVLGVRLFERGADGRMRPTQAGEIAARRAEAMETEAGRLVEAVTGADAFASGTVRVTAVPILVNRVLVPAAGELVTRHPLLRLELIAESRGLNLTHREADIALRLARPGDDAGKRVLARRIGTLTYAAYASTAIAADPAKLPWLTYEDGMARLPQTSWIAENAQKGGGIAAIVMNDAEAILQAVKAGLGRSLLPCIVADQMPDLARLPNGDTPLPEREMWLLTHPDLRHLTRISAVLAWMEHAIMRLVAASHQELR
ncbi:LysR family transcriptional regulator [Mesorhizobium sp. B1-1-5]|uniref:LysR family transcriptional regulator n=1 Tax=Mesorhizobium sp. B1-1-5 TaxID=2589979 RepID=UPI0011292CEF|nr:LysR family transcriptional regulator [Mesorhizobium sp. B1-1-5]TPO07144.1 LysR family transcriptional regulator [Mesorhizobium sp. B1-1-5]